MSTPPRTLVIGLDCVPPALAFDPERGLLPSVRALAERGLWGPLRSSSPPITVPAWTCMVSGHDPGELGIYGFRNRVPNGYGMRLATSAHVQAPRLWDILGQAGLRVASLFVPLTWPCMPVHGVQVSGMLTPPDASTWAYPVEVQQDLLARFGRYIPDVPAVRNQPKAHVLEALFAMTRQHFEIARYVWDRHQPHFMMMVEIGTDRLHHIAWDELVAQTPPDELGRLARSYYRFVDREVAKLIEAAGPDTHVLVVSDHGARRMEGAVHLNEWLKECGWLYLHDEPEALCPLSDARVDWSRTRAWAEGGYYGRVFLNVRGREPEGCVAKSDYESTRSELAEALEAMEDASGQPLGNVVERPEETYRRTEGFAPDLCVYLGNLRYRSAGTVGEGRIFSPRNDTGPDSCNHDWNGVLAMAGPNVAARGYTPDMTLYDVTPTVLGLMGVEHATKARGRDWSQP